MQATSDITENTEYPVNLMYSFLYPAERNDEARTADWCAALSDATSSVEGTDPQSEESDQAQLPSQEPIFDPGSFDPNIAKPEELGLPSSFTLSMAATQIGFLILPEPTFIIASPMQSMLECGAPLHTFPSAFPSTFPSPVPRAYGPSMFTFPTTCYNDNAPTALPEFSGQQRHFSPALHHNKSHKTSAYRAPHASSTSSNRRGSSAPNSIMSAPALNHPSDPPPHPLPPPPPSRPSTLQTPSPTIVGGGPGHMFRCAKEQLEFDISQHRSPQQPPCITDAMKGRRIARAFPEQPISADYLDSREGVSKSVELEIVQYKATIETGGFGNNYSIYTAI